MRGCCSSPCLPRNSWRRSARRSRKVVEFIIRGTHKYQYGSLKAETLRDASGEEVGEILYLTMPGTKAVLTTNPFGAVGLLNDLGAKGWEAVSDEWTSRFERIVLLRRRQKDA